MQGVGRVPAEHALERAASQSLRWRRQSSGVVHDEGRALALGEATAAAALDVDGDAQQDSAARKKRSSHKAVVRSQAASPEVISSLIDQLAAISASTQSQLEGIGGPAAATGRGPASASASTSASASAAGRGPPPTRPPYYSAIREHNDLFADDDDDDACEPPVVRTSKPPSGLSPMTAPPKTRRDKTLALASYVGRSAGSSASITSCHSVHSVQSRHSIHSVQSRHSIHSHRSSSSFGNISIEAAPRPASSRSSAESKRSVKRPRSLMYMSSRERLLQKETDTHKHLNASTSPSPVSPRKGTAPLFPYQDTIKEEPLARDPDAYVIAEPARFVHRYPSRTASPARRVRLNLVDGPGVDVSMDHAMIPDRASSLRHGRKSSANGAKGTGRAERLSHTAPRLPMPDMPDMETPREVQREENQAQREENQAQREENQAQREDDPQREAAVEDEDQDEARRQKLLRELEHGENQVAQRIKQLREQKLLRDRIAGKLPADPPADPGPAGKPDVSALSSPDDSPTSPTSTLDDDHAPDSAKAHKLLGISTPPPAPRSTLDSDLNKPLPSIAPRQPTRPPPLPPHLRHSRHRSLTVNDGDGISLPINYALALKSLDTSAPSSPCTPRVDSTHMSLPPPPSIIAPSPPPARDGIKRSSSLSLGARSAFSRKANSMVVAGSKGHHRHSSSLTDERPHTVRSVSEEATTGRHSSLSMASASNSFSLQQKKTLKKKRWSHPDLPAKAEKAHNAKVDAAEAADARAAEQRASHYPMNPWSPVIEERPNSLDSVDMDVNAYLHAPRLSQKIRHPQTGRIISFSEVGDPNGYAVFVCVGMGLTRFVMAFYDQLAATLKLRLITPERPGVAASQPDPNGTPLTWPDDILAICQALRITKFSLLAHSAGAIYALATALRMPQHIRGRVHLLAPWIPPSQMAPIGIGRDSPPTQQLPRSQRFLRALPPSLLRVANSTFLSNQSASLHGPAKAPKQKRPRPTPTPSRTSSPAPRPLLKDSRRESMLLMDQILPSASTLTLTSTHTHDPAAERARLEALSAAERARASAYDERLTFAIWDRATAGANPATDLMVCLETKHPIGFRYEDINRPVVIHHGSKDSRVPVDNVRWLGNLMRKCEVRVLDGEQHGLMASARVMGNVLAEMAAEWGDWEAVVRHASVGDLRGVARRVGG